VHHRQWTATTDLNLWSWIQSWHNHSFATFSLHLFLAPSSMDCHSRSLTNHPFTNHPFAIVCQLASLCTAIDGLHTGTTSDHNLPAGSDPDLTKKPTILFPLPSTDWLLVKLNLITT
jgi:hypothetical protein